MHRFLERVVLLTFLISTITSCKSNPAADTHQDGNSEQFDMSAVVLTQSDSTEVKSIMRVMKENQHLPVEQRVALFYQLKKEEPKGYDFDNEEDLNMYGYSLLWENQVTDAIEIFKMIVAEFPESSNAYDSLGEAYLANGEKELSLWNYEKSLELNPENFNAEDQITFIKYPEKMMTPIEKRRKIYSVAEYREDLDDLASQLVEINPSAFKFISEQNFYQLVEDKKALIHPATTFGEFAWHCAEVVASLDCSHTHMGGFYSEGAMVPEVDRFPLIVRWQDDKLFVINALENKERVRVGDEIVQINGVKVQSILDDIYRHISTQGYVETTKRLEFNRWAGVMISTSLGYPEKYSVTIKDFEEPVVLEESRMAWAPVEDTSLDMCEDELCLEFIDNKTAIITIQNFNWYRWNRYDEFVAWADHTFARLQEKSIHKLIVDVRSNGGGSPESSIYFLRHLMSEPFVYFKETDYSEGKGEQMPMKKNRFDGDCYFLIDGNGQSTTGHFMAMVKYHDLGTIVGEELGSNQFCTGGQKTCRTENTHLQFYVAMGQSQLGLPMDDTRGVMPDVSVNQTIEQFLAGEDVVKIKAIELTQK